MVIVVAGIKGGTGKTTIATNLAIIRAQNASDVLLIDADSQSSAFDFSTVREEEGHQPEITCSSITGRGISAEIRKLIPKFDDIIIDVGGRDTTTLRSALLVADVLVIPILPSQFDSWAAEMMDHLVGEVCELNQNLTSILFLNKVDTNPKIDLTSETIDCLKEIKNLKYSEITIGYRVAFRRSIADGLAVTELKHRSDKKSIMEINKLYKEVFKNA